MEPVQLVIIAISVILTSLFIALGIQFWFILKEVRGSMQRVNKMLDDTGKITGAFGDGVSNMSGLMNGLRAGISLVTSLQKKGEKNE